MIATLESPSSVAVAWVDSVQETAAPAEEVASTDAGAVAQVIAGLVVSTTVTSKVQVRVLLLPSVAVAVIVCVPIAKVAPETTAVPLALAYAMVMLPAA